MVKVNITSPSKMVVDGHWFTRSRFAIVRKENPECTFMKDIERDKKTFWKKLTMDLFAEIRNLGGMIDQVIITSDFVSWRKQIEYIHAPWVEFSDDSYKSQREYDEEINWKALNNAFSEWAELIEKHFNIPYLKVHGAEGDDWMFLVKTILNKMGLNCLLFATDGDTNQNVALLENGAFTGVYKKVRGGKMSATSHVCHYTAPKTVISTIVEGKTAVDMFNFNPLAPKIDDCYKRYFNVFNDDLHPIAFVLEKIILGDSKDNIFPIIYRKKVKMMKPQIKALQKGCELMGVPMNRLTADHLYNKDFITGVLQYLHDSFMKMETLPEDYKEYYYNKFVQNRALVYLSTKEIPIVLVDKMKEKIKEKFNAMKGTTNILNCGNYHNVLESIGVYNVVNSNYGKKGGDIDPFAELDDLFKS